MKFIEERGVARWLLIVHVLLLLFLWWIPLQSFSSLPDQIAVHFDSNGVPDRFEPRTSLKIWMVPFIAMTLGLGILILTLFPGLYDFPGKKEVNRWPEQMRLPVYAVIKEMVLAVLICLDVLWMSIEYGIVASARSGHQTILWAGIIVPALVPIALLVYYLNRISNVIETVRTQVG